MAISDIIQESSIAQLERFMTDISKEPPKEHDVKSVLDYFPDTVNPEFYKYIAAKEDAKVLARKDSAGRLAIIFPASEFYDSRVNEWRAVPASILKEECTEDTAAYIAHSRHYREIETIIATVSRENDEMIKKFINNPEIYIDLYKNSGAIIYQGKDLIGFAFD